MSQYVRYKDEQEVIIGTGMRGRMKKHNMSAWKVIMRTMIIKK